MLIQEVEGVLVGSIVFLAAVNEISIWGQKYYVVALGHRLAGKAKAAYTGMHQGLYLTLEAADDAAVRHLRTLEHRQP